MTNENPTPTAAEAQPDLAKARNEVNTLLHQLEGMVDAPQHQFLTDFLMEWSVLSAMRTTLAVQNKASTVAAQPAGQTETKSDEALAASGIEATTTESGKTGETNSDNESGKGE